MLVLRCLVRPVRHCPQIPAATAWETALQPPPRHSASFVPQSTRTLVTTRSVATKTAQEATSSAVDALLQGARLTQGAHYAWSMLVQPGDVVVDATCGNGHDTLELAKMVGRSGRVVAFDIQAEALASAQALLDSQSLDTELCRDVRFVQACHSTMQDVVGSNIARVVAFNLGYLPGGDKAVTTATPSTLAAVEAALEVVGSGGVVSILAYTGHPGGAEEYDAVKQLIAQLPPAYWVVMEHRLLNRPKAPILLLAWRR